MKQTYLYIIGLIVILSGCIPYEPDLLTAVKMDYSDEELQQLIDLKDKRETDSLSVYLSSNNPTYRYAAAMGFASSKDKAALKHLYPLLNDPVDNVRGAIAYAIGQIGDSTSVVPLIKAFDSKDSLRQFNYANSQILEAVGKCGNKEELFALAMPTKYTAKDTLLLLGQSRGIYRMATRGITSPKGTAKMMEYASDKKYPEEVRLMAANYLHRARGIQIDSAIAKVCQDFRTEENPNLRMALATAIAKSKLLFAKDSLISFLKTEEDYRVKCNIIRSLSYLKYYQVAPQVYATLEDENPHVAQTAADYFYHNGVAAEGGVYKRIARRLTNPYIKAKLYAAANKNMSVYYTQAKSGITTELLQVYKTAINVQEKAAILDALSEFEWNYPQMQKLGLDSKEPALKSAGAKGLQKILTSKKFNATFGTSSRRIGNEIRGILTQELRKGKDAGVIYHAAEAVADEKAAFKPFFEQVGGYRFLDTVLQNITLPNDIETYKSVEKAIAFLDGKENPNTKPAYNHPIKWDLVKRVNNRTRAIIQTNKGKIILSFFPQYAPASTGSFIRLAQKNYFDGKAVHRVVPNFVIQAGCNRGDGYGSSDFTIRSEFSNQYYDDEGYVGMASAGNDTEGTQWFITHSPTPHLDGNYTIFAKVKEGMDVVHQLEIGDIVEKVVVRF